MGVSSAISPSVIARVLGIKTAYKPLTSGGIVFLPQRLMLVGQGNTAAVYDTVKRVVFSAQEVAETYGFGSPLHLTALQLLPQNGDGIGTVPLTVYPLEDSGTGVAATGDITPTVAATEAAEYRVAFNNIPSEAFVVDGDDDAASTIAKMLVAVNAVTAMPVTVSDGTTTMDFVSNWKGLSANAIYAEVIGPTDLGVTFAFTQANGGLVNPTVDAALAQVGNVWETMGLNCLNKTDTTALDTIATFGEGRWGATVRKPLIFFTGDENTTVADAIVIPETRKTDRTNSQLVSPDSNDLPFVTAARELARIIKLANDNPPFDYGSQLANGLTPGTDGNQWNLTQRNAAMLGGSSTIEVKDSEVYCSDTITFYHPTGETFPPYRYVVDIVKLQNTIFNLDLIFNVPAWDGAPLIPDDQVTNNPGAKKPRMAVAAAAKMVDELGLAAILSDPATTKKAIVAAISEVNPKRWDMRVPVNVSGNSNVKSIDLDFGFFFGTAPVVG